MGTQDSSPANKSLRGSRGPEAGGRGVPSPLINLDERGRETPHPSLLPLVLVYMLMRKDFLDEVLDRPTFLAIRKPRMKHGSDRRRSRPRACFALSQLFEP